MARKPSKAETLPKLDPKALESLMNAMASQLAARRTSQAVDEAQELMFDAWESGDRKQRVALARKALSISADCADAYLLLAQEAAATPAEALATLAEGVAAGARALGEAAFEEDAGHFWGLIETRPYMRARHSLAVALWDTGRRDEAAGHGAELLRLNPNDNQGVRYMMLNWLLALGRDDEAKALLARYKDAGDGQWAWPAALAAFSKGGDTAAARKALTVAKAANAHVAGFLTGRKKLPKEAPPYYSPGDENEAALYVEDNGGAQAWAATPGALAWVKGQA